jgi:hypothetical protein
VVKPEKEPGKPAAKCKKGFVKKQGKCVKQKRKKRSNTRKAKKGRKSRKSNRRGK